VLAASLACAGGPAGAAEPTAPPLAASAAEDGAADAAQSARAMDDALGALESTRRAVRSATVWLGRTIDSWFGDLPFDDESAVQGGRLSLSLGTRQGDDPDINLRFDARMRLPNVERQGYLFLGRDDPREVVSDTPDEVSRQSVLAKPAQAADPSFFAGLGVTRHSIDYRLGFRGGLKPYAQARYRQSWTPSPDNLIEFRETVFWSVDDRFGSTTTLSYTHAFSPTLSTRWFNSATITQETRAFEWSSILGTYKAFGGQRSLGAELILSGTQGTGVPVSDYGLQLRWEQPAYEDWLLLELIVGHFWPRDDALQARGREWAVGGSLKLLF
jgi:hypothetical protein